MDEKPPPPSYPPTDQQPTGPPPPSSSPASASQPQPTSQSQSNRSLVNKIQSSATGLLNSALSNNASGSTGNDISATLVAGLSGKGGGSGSSAGGSSAGRGASASLAREGVSRGGFRSSESIRSNEHDMFGTGTNTSTVREEFERFEQNDTLDGGSSNNNAADLNFLRQLSAELEQETVSAPISPAEWEQGLLLSSRSSTSNGKGKARETTQDADITPFLERAWEQQQQQQQSNPALDSNDDGHAVTSLLSDPSFQPLDFDINNLDDDDISSHPNPYLAPPSHPAPSTQQQQQINPLSLIPGLSDILSTPPSTSTTTTTETLREQDISSLSNILGATDELWLSLDAVYHDAVYGNWIEPYVVAAREEVREAEMKMKKNEGAGPAVRRLGLILGHLRGRVGRDGDGDGTAAS